jgi:hypothetical protein
MPVFPVDPELIFTAAIRPPGPLEVWLIILGFIIMIPVYFLPTIIAAVSRKPNLLSVFLVNFLAGWTFVGWIVALVMVLTRTDSDKASAN